MAHELSQVVRGFASRTQEPIQKSIQSAIALEETFTKQYGELMQGIVGESLTKLKTFNSEATQLELISAGPDARVANEKKRRSSTLLESIAQTGSLPGADPPPEGY
ncbi:MAG: hypothetical protein EZS28_056186 [Streblomastix strix]|uniref:Uncharacterized protein n=1 Tax=Streblomastix strix TaxID=222440 RepID=A0A5J4PPI7_9EUKA|nr:MAG: hypothetical protein EZS28_056186 [Streblomastix strix]